MKRRRHLTPPVDPRELLGLHAGKVIELAMWQWRQHADKGNVVRVRLPDLCKPRIVGNVFAGEFTVSISVPLIEFEDPTPPEEDP